MSTVESIISELKSKGSEQTRSIYIRHGMPADKTFGVSIADLKVIAKTIKGQQALAYDLYATGSFEAMYLAGLVADGAKMTREQLQAWAVGTAGINTVSEYTVPWVTVENPAARDLAMEWIGSPSESVAASGWCTYAGLLANRPDSALDLNEIEALLGKVESEIGAAQNRVRSTMNAFVIAVGTYVKPLLEAAKASAERIGDVSVDKGATACKVPVAIASIAKVEAANKTGQKRKTIRC